MTGRGDVLTSTALLRIERRPSYARHRRMARSLVGAQIALTSGRAACGERDEGCLKSLDLASGRRRQSPTPEHESKGQVQIGNSNGLYIGPLTRFVHQHSQSLPGLIPIDWKALARRAFLMLTVGPLGVKGRH